MFWFKVLFTFWKNCGLLYINGDLVTLYITYNDLINFIIVRILFYTKKVEKSDELTLT